MNIINSRGGCRYTPYTPPPPPPGYGPDHVDISTASNSSTVYMLQEEVYMRQLVGCEIEKPWRRRATGVQPKEERILWTEAQLS